MEAATSREIFETNGWTFTAQKSRMCGSEELAAYGRGNSLAHFAKSRAAPGLSTTGNGV